MVKGNIKKKFIAESASESESETSKIEKKTEKKVEKKVFDSSEEEEDEEMTKEDLEFLKEEDEDEDSEDGDGEEASDSEGEISPDELSDDDLELIEENLGKRRTQSRGKGASSSAKNGKFKRLRRRNEIESSDREREEEEDREKKVEKKRNASELQNLFNDDENGEEEEESSDSEDDLKDFIEDDEEERDSDDDLPETIDAAMKSRKQKAKSTSTSGIPRRRAIVDDREAPKRALSSALASGQISKQAWDEMMEIFGDGTDYLDMVLESGDEEQVNEKRTSASEGESRVDLKDIPERFVEMNIEIVEDDVEFDAFLQKESTFIAKKLQKLHPVDSLSGLTSAILSVLRFVHHHGLEVPFIATYRKEYFANFFGLNEIWSILDEDAKYRQANQVKKKIKEKLKDVEEGLINSDREYIYEALESEWDESQLQFIQEFLIKRKTISKPKSAILLDFAHKLAPSASNFAENSRKRRVLHGPLILNEREMENEAIEVVAREVASSVDAAINLAVSVLAEEYGSNPQLFSEIRDLCLNQATITVTPTALGSIEISHDPTHYLLPIQYIVDKTINTFTEEQGLALARGLEAKLITVEYNYGKDFEGLMRDLKQYLPGMEKFKGEVFRAAWTNHWMPRLNGLVLQKLRSEAENWVAQFAQFYLLEKLMVPALNMACASLDDDEIAVSSINLTKETIYLVELDRNGRVMRQEILKTKHALKFESILRHSLSPRSAFIVISGEGQDCLEMYRDLKESPLYESIPIIWGCDDTAQIFKTSMRSAREFAECPQEVKYAVSVGRRMLNPVSEFSSMTDEELLQLSLHALQAHVPRALRLRHLQRALVNVINLFGVPINELVLPGLKQAMLSYVSGLGPQKAAQLAKRLGSKWLHSRAELITQYDMGRRTFTNCAGFIKITAERIKSSGKKKSSYSSGARGNLIEPLDGTRIHPESYELARKMAADALELDDPTTVQRRQDIFGDDEDALDESERTAAILANGIVQIMKDPKKLDDLLLDEYAKEIEKLKHLPKYTTLKEIKSELQCPFPDPRGNAVRSEEFSRVTPVSQVVRMLTSRDESWWYVGRPVTIKLLHPVSRNLANLVDANGLIVGVQGEIPRTMRPGTPAHAYLIKIDLNKLMVDVCLKRPSNQEELLTQFVRFDPFYNFNRAASAIITQSSSQQSSPMKSKGPESSSVTSAPASSRQLSHPAFKALNREDSERLLSLAPTGDFLIRPSSQRRHGGDLPGDLTLTWKVGQGIFSHVPLGEADRVSGQDWNLGKTLLLPALIPGAEGKMKIDKFEDLDEIVGRRIEPVVSLLQEAQACPKYFSNPSSDAINVHLKDQAALNPGRIPYCITLALEPNCGHLMLSHPSGVRQELIRVDPRGYALTDPKTGELKIFDRIEMLVDYFKRNYKHFSVKKEQAATSSKSAGNAASSALQGKPTLAKQVDDPRSKYQQFAN